MKIHVLFLGLCLSFSMSGWGQAQGAFYRPMVTLEKENALEVVMAIDVSLSSIGGALPGAVVELSIDNTSTLSETREPGKVAIRQNLRTVNLASKPVNRTFYLVIDKSVTSFAGKTIVLKGVIRANGVDFNFINTMTIRLIEPYGSFFNNEYFSNPTIHLDSITRVESNNNILTIYGYKDGILTKRVVLLKQHQVFAFRERAEIFGANFWNSAALSLTTVPFKVRPQIQTKDSLFKTNASTGLTNIGMNLDLAQYSFQRYFSNGKKTIHKFSFGIWAAPSVEELDSLYTAGFLHTDVKSKQLFISTGLTLNYSYNDITLVFVPAGWDFPTSTTGSKWIYSKRRWWGFGIGITPRFFAAILNK